MKIAVHTLGCKVNQCDADALVSALCEIGHDAFSVRKFDRDADVFIINTCTVTQIADRKSRRMIRRAKRQNPNAIVAMCGCMPQARRATPLEDSRGAVSVSKPDSDTVFELVDFVFDAREPQDFIKKISGGGSNAAPSIPKNSKTRAFIKIQDGCDRFCSYCIVPYVRGAVKSRPMAEILAEAADALARGTQEIVLTGIQVAAYGQNKEKLTDLIKMLAESGVGRLRLSSIDPWAIDGEFLAAVRETPALCPHFHLSLQSGCDATLEKMNRRYTTADYARAAENLRKIRPDVALTTDIIVGFPGETDADFAASVDFVRQMKFSQLHVFEFSAREGTAAAGFPSQVSPEIKHERGKIMREAAEALQKKFLQAQVGKTLFVLFETATTGLSENYCKVQVKNAKKNSIEKIKITRATQNTLKGEIYGNTKN